jgi:hypothetical protein
MNMKNRHIDNTAHLPRTALMLFLNFVIYICTPAASVLCADGWTRGRPIGTFPAGEVPFEPFVLSVWGSDGSGVSGLCSYYNAKSHPFEIDGEETSSGEFYPDVLYQVSNGDGDWETLEVPIVKRGKRTTITVESRTTSRPLRVNLDMFVSLIGKVKYGSVVLKMGERAAFLIDELQPPGAGDNNKESSKDPP